MGWNDKMETLAHWVVTGKRGAAVRKGVDISSDLVTVLEPGTAVVSAGAPLGETGGRLRLVSPAAGFASVKVLRSTDNGAVAAEVKAPKAATLRAPADGPLPLYYVNCDACEDRRALLEAECERHRMEPRRVAATTPDSPAYRDAAADDARAPHMIPTDDVATGAGANAIILSFLEAFRAAAAGPGDGPRLVTEDDVVFSPNFRRRLETLGDHAPRDADAMWLWSSTWDESREALGIPEPNGGHRAGAYYDEWPRYAKGHGGWKGALVITCQPGICLCTKRGAARIADAIDACTREGRWKPFDVMMPTVGARRDGGDLAQPRMYLAGDLELLTPTKLKSVRACESHKAAAADAILRADDAAALLERALVQRDAAADAALGEIVVFGVLSLSRSLSLVKPLFF